MCSSLDWWRPVSDRYYFFRTPWQVCDDISGSVDTLPTKWADHRSHVLCKKLCKDGHVWSISFLTFKMKLNADKKTTKRPRGRERDKIRRLKYTLFIFIIFIFIFKNWSDLSNLFFIIYNSFKSYIFNIIFLLSVLCFLILFKFFSHFSFLLFIYFSFKNHHVKR